MLCIFNLYIFRIYNVYHDYYSRWLLDDEINSLYNVKRRMLLYRGNTTYKIYNDKKIDIINIEEFLDNLDKFLKDNNVNLIKARVF